MASVRKLPSGRWQGNAKSGRVRLGTRTFDTRRAALAWAERTEAAASGGVDVRAGKARVRDLLGEWVAWRTQTVAPKTARTDAEVIRLMSPALGARAVGSVMPVEVERWLVGLREQHHQSDGSIRRYRASLSAFFAWTVTDHRRGDNPVAAAKLPAQMDPPDEMHPFTEDELSEVVQRIERAGQRHLADVVLIAGWTGVRWGELRALRAGDVQRLPLWALRVARSQSEGGQVKVTKGRASRRVPLPDHIATVIERAAAGKSADEWLLTGPVGGQLWRSALIRTTGWKRVGMGRRLHDLRHTAACLWLARGVDLGTVSAWMGHASVVTTNRYLHFLGSSADRAGVERLNQAGGAHGAHAIVTAIDGTGR